MSPLREQSQQDVLSLFEGALDLAAKPEGVGDLAEKSEADFVFDYVADDRPPNIFVLFLPEFMAVMPALERPLVLDVGEVMVPFELGDARNPLGTHG